jgi:hypothetical protein
MKVTFADSFFKSLDAMRRHDTWWYKIYQAIRYDIPRFFKTIWLFRKELYGYYTWDHSYPMNVFKRGLILLSDHLEEFGHEVDGPRTKKVEKMRRAIELLQSHTNDGFIELAEEDLGEKVNIKYLFEDGEPDWIKPHNKAIYERANQIEEDTWYELFQILKGQDVSECPKDTKYDDWFDGSGLKSWWD